MHIAWVLIALVVATVLLHLASPWWLTPLASNWGAIDTTINLSFWVTGIVFVAVNLFLAWVVWRYQHRPDSRAHYEPENKPLEGWLTVLTSIGVAAMLIPGLFVYANIVNPPTDSIEVEAIGQQWQWTFRLPGEDGELGAADARFVTDQNPYGLDPEDPDGQDDLVVASQRLHLPVDQPVKLLLRSNDVLHNFAVPQFRIKMDLVPGTQTYQWVTPSRTGSFDILCEELCGLAHYTMRGQVIVEEPSAFETWRAGLPTFAQTQRQHSVDLAAGEQLYQQCAACHGADGSGNPDLNAPNLTVLEPWYMERQLGYYRDGIRGTEERDAPGQQMAGMVSVLATGADTRNVLAYIDSLDDVATATRLEGDAQRGATVYQPCAVCHGQQAQGEPYLNAPRLAGQSDVYLKRQLEHFSLGWRGDHPQDRFGTQMRLMTRTIHNPERLKDLLAYIASLRAEGDPS